jgi:hypothetical protein
VAARETPHLGEFGFSRTPLLRLSSQETAALGGDLFEETAVVSLLFKHAYADQKGTTWRSSEDQ